LTALTSATAGGIVSLFFGLDEDPYSSIADSVAGYGSQSYQVQSGAGPVHAKGYVAMAKVMGVTKERLYAEENYGALVNTNPAVPAFLNLYFQGHSTGSTTGLEYSLKLTYYVRYYGLKNLAMTAL